MRFKRTIFGIAILLLFVIVLSNPGFAAEYTLSSLLFFGKTVFPSLFLALCLSSLLLESPILEKLYCAPFGVEVAVLLFGILCGFPVGARCAVRLYETGRIHKKRAEFLCTFSNLASFPFLTGVVGRAMYGSLSFGIRLSLLQAVSALIIMLVFYLAMKPDCKGIVPTVKSMPIGLTEAVSSSVMTMLSVGGMLVFFGVIGELLLSCFAFSEMAAVLLRGIVEFSSGCRAASGLEGTLSLLSVGFSVGGSGVCVGAQVSSVLNGKLSLKPYLAAKCLQSVLLPFLLLITG